MRRTAALLACLLSGPAAAQDGLASWQRDALALVRADRKVVEAIFPQGAANSLWISVADDGSRRDGLAESFCLDIADEVDGLVVIRIYDAAAMARGESIELGRFDCAL